MSSRIIETARFSATAANGQRHTIIELTEMLDATTLSDTRRQEIPGAKRYRTSNGKPVNARADGSFELVESGVVLTRC